MGSDRGLGPWGLSPGRLLGSCAQPLLRPLSAAERRGAGRRSFAQEAVTRQGWKGARESGTQLKDQSVQDSLYETQENDAKLIGSSKLAAGKGLNRMEDSKNFIKPVIPATCGK